MKMSENERLCTLASVFTLTLSEREIYVGLSTRKRRLVYHPDGSEAENMVSFLLINYTDVLSRCGSPSSDEFLCEELIGLLNSIALLSEEHEYLLSASSQVAGSGILGYLWMTVARLSKALLTHRSMPVDLNGISIDDLVDEFTEEGGV